MACTLSLKMGSSCHLILPPGNVPPGFCFSLLRSSTLSLNCWSSSSNASSAAILAWICATWHFPILHYWKEKWFFLEFGAPPGPEAWAQKVQKIPFSSWSTVCHHWGVSGRRRPPLGQDSQITAGKNLVWGNSVSWCLVYLRAYFYVWKRMKLKRSEEEKNLKRRYRIFKLVKPNVKKVKMYHRNLLEINGKFIFN